MMISKRLLLTMAAAGMIFSFTSCKKAEEPAKPADTPQQAETPVQAEAPVANPTPEVPAPAAVVISDWKKEDVNSLLMFVPDNSPFVVGSTRELDYNHPVIKKLFTMYSQTMDKYVELMNKLSTETDSNMLDDEAKKTFQASLKMMNMVSDLLKDYHAVAPEFGLNPDHQDQIIYLDGSNLVAKVTVDDSNKVKSKMNELFRMLPDMSENMFKTKEVMIGNEPWLYASFSDNNTNDSPIQAQIDDLKAKRDEAVKANNTEAVERFNETIANLERLNNTSGNDDYLSIMNFAIHYGQGVVTVVLMANEKDFDNYARFLRPAPKPMDKATLGAAEPNVIALGFLDNVNGFDKLMAGEARKILEDIINMKYTDDCNREFKEIIANYPKLSLAVRVDGDNKFIMDSTLSFSDKESLKKLQEYHTPSLPILSDKTQIGLKFNLALDKLLAHIIGLADSLSTTSYKCALLSEIATQAKQLPVLVTDPQFRVVKMAISGISGLNLSLDQLTFDKNNQVKTLEGIVNITGPSISDVATLAIPSLSTEIPAVANLSVDGKPITVDLSNLANIPVKLNANLTQTDFTAATSSYNVKNVSAAERVQNSTFFEFVMSPSFYSSVILSALDNEVKNSDDTFNDIMHEIYKFWDMDYRFSIGTNDEGLLGSSEIIFK